MRANIISFTGSWSCTSTYVTIFGFYYLIDWMCERQCHHQHVAHGLFILQIWTFKLLLLLLSILKHTFQVIFRYIYVYMVTIWIVRISLHISVVMYYCCSSRRLPPYSTQRVSRRVRNSFNNFLLSIRQYMRKICIRMAFVH